jgi:hypothetical protein
LAQKYFSIKLQTALFQNTFRFVSFPNVVSWQLNGRFICEFNGARYVYQDASTRLADMTSVNDLAGKFEAAKANDEVLRLKISSQLP